MSYLYHKFEGEDAKKKATDDLLGMGLPEEEARDIEKIEIWCSSFKDPGGDWTEYRAFDEDGNRVRTRRMSGY